MCPREDLVALITGMKHKTCNQSDKLHGHTCCSRQKQTSVTPTMQRQRFSGPVSSLMWKLRTPCRCPRGLSHGFMDWCLYLLDGDADECARKLCWLGSTSIASNSEAACNSFCRESQRLQSDVLISVCCERDEPGLDGQPELRVFQIASESFS